MMFIPGCPCCCAECTAECDTTPDDNFETVYQANDTDGALQWEGDAMGPIDGPYPGFEGSGPFSQTITLAENFSATMPGTRFPCYARVKFWRNVGGGEGSETVTSSVTITCTAGKVNIGPITLAEGESAYFGPDPDSSTATYRFETADAIPLASGGDDQSLSPPASWFSAAAECSPSSISVQATIAWSNAAIQHNLYGTFVECYDELPPGDPGDCLDCDGTPTPAPETVYLTISNFDGGGLTALDGVGGGTISPSLLPSQDGEYAIPLAATVVDCRQYDLALLQDLCGWVWPGSGPPGVVGLSRVYITRFGIVLSLNCSIPFGTLAANHPLYPNQPYSLGGHVVAIISLAESQLDDMLCGGSAITGAVTAEATFCSVSPAGSGYFVSFDWELSL